jgi:hypothetical protein
MRPVAMIVAGIEANNIKARELAGEEDTKDAQNVAAGVAGSDSRAVVRDGLRARPRYKVGGNI